MRETRLRTREGSIAAETTGLYRVEQLDRGTKPMPSRVACALTGSAPARPRPCGWPRGRAGRVLVAGGPRAERSRLYGDAFSDWVLAESRAEGDWQVARYVSPR